MEMPPSGGTHVYDRHWKDLGETTACPELDPGELKAELERRLGFACGDFRRLVCVNSLNFRTMRKSDGFEFVVKCLPEWRRPGYDLIVRHLKELRGSKAVQRVFEETCPSVFRGYRLVCLSWCDGQGVFADRMSDREWKSFLEDYVAFSRSLQRATAVLPPYPTRRWRSEALSKCKGLFGRLLRRVIERIPEDESGFRQDRLRVTHGDLHPGNFAFANGRVTGFLDVEGLTFGYPAWDLLRYFYFCLTHTSPLAVRRRRLLWRRFSEAVRLLPYDGEEWRVSINAMWFEQVWKKAGGRRLGASACLRLLFRSRIFDRLRMLV